MKIFLALIILLNSFLAVAGTIEDCRSFASQLRSGRTPAAAPQCNTAGQLMSVNVSARDFTQICRRIVDQDPGCKKLKPEKKMSCNAKRDNEILSSADLLSKVGQCAKGFLWDSMVDLAKFVFDIIKVLVGVQIKTYTAMVKFLTDSEFRDRTIASAKGTMNSGSRLGFAFLNQASLYFAREFQRNLASNPLNPLAAVGKTLLSPLLKFVTESVQSIIAHYVPQYQCMNGTAKLYTFCKLAGDFIMPPVFMFTMLRAGVRGLQLMKQGAQAKKIAEFERNFATANQIREGAAVSHGAANPRRSAIIVDQAEGSAARRRTPGGDRSASKKVRPEAHPARPQPVAPLTKPIEEHSADELIEVARSSRADDAAATAAANEAELARIQAKTAAEATPAAPVAQAADEAENLGVLVTGYKTDPVYAALFPKKKPYAEYDEELSIVISHMERTNPGMSKAKIREEIEKNINSCPL